jgi:hypothetical protein
MERREKCVKLRAIGASYSMIGAQLGISAQRAHRCVTEALNAQAARQSSTTEQYRDVELERLDMAQRKVMAVLERSHVYVSGGKIVYDGKIQLIDDAPVLAAVDRLVRISERRAHLLGLDAAMKVAGPEGEPLFGDPEAIRAHLLAMLDQAAENRAKFAEQSA